MKGAKEKSVANGKIKKTEKTEKKKTATRDTDTTEIDELFTKKKPEPPVVKTTVKKPVKIEKNFDVRGTTSTARRLTDDGLPIYTDKEMGLGVDDQQGGNTAECPFDCSCCY